MITPYQVLRCAERVTQKPVRIITGRSRREGIVTIRDACILIVHENTRMSSSEIAPTFRRDRSAISYAISRSIDRLETCRHFKAVYESILEQTKTK